MAGSQEKMYFMHSPNGENVLPQKTYPNGHNPILLSKNLLKLLA